MSDDDRMDALLRQMAAEEYNRPPDIVPREQMWEAVQQGLGTGLQGLGTRDEGLGGGVARISARLAHAPRWVYLAVAAVVLLAVGIQIGRQFGGARSGQQQMVAVPNRPATPDTARSGTSPDSARGAAEPNAGGAEPVQPERQVARSDDSDKPKPGPRPGGPELAPSNNPPRDAANAAYTVATVQHLTQVEALLTSFKGDLNEGRMDSQMASWGKDLLTNTRLLLDSPAARDPVRRKLLQDLELVLVQIVQLSPGAPARDRDLIKGALTDDQVLTRLRTAIPARQRGT